MIYEKKNSQNGLLSSLKIVFGMEKILFEYYIDF